MLKGGEASLALLASDSGSLQATPWGLSPTYQMGLGSSNSVEGALLTCGTKKQSHSFSSTHLQDLGKLRQVDQEFKANLAYMRSCQKERKKKKAGTQLKKLTVHVCTRACVHALFVRGGQGTGIHACLRASVMANIGGQR